MDQLKRIFFLFGYSWPISNKLATKRIKKKIGKHIPIMAAEGSLRDFAALCDRLQQMRRRATAVVSVAASPPHSVTLAIQTAQSCRHWLGWDLQCITQHTTQSAHWPNMTTKFEFIIKMYLKNNIEEVS